MRLQSCRPLREHTGDKTAMTDVLLLTFLAGLAAFAGAGLGRIEGLKPDWLSCESRHAIMAFGGGALLAAVALVLVPKGMADIALYLSAPAFLTGAVFFLCVDRALALSGTKLSQFMAMMLDFVPESIVLGAIITTHYSEAVFLTVLIAAQNGPEGFNAFREMRSGDGAMSTRRVLALMGLASLSGMVWGSLGYFLLTPDSAVLQMVMMFCAGGIFFLVFRDIAPGARVEKSYLPSLGAVAGFMIGIIGHGLA